MIKKSVIPFIDMDTSEKSLIIVRCEREIVEICLSPENEGPLRVLMGKREAVITANALRTALGSME